jgi:hypothetical protein
MTFRSLPAASNTHHRTPAYAGARMIDGENSMFRIVETDNYGGDYPDEQWAMPYHLREEAAKEIARVLNNYLCDSRYFKVVNVGYELAPGFEP